LDRLVGITYTSKKAAGSRIVA